MKSSFEMASDPETDSSEHSDTDDELQRAFVQKELQPGLFKLVPQRERLRINNIVGLQDKLRDFKLNMPWIERLDMCNEPAVLAPELANKMEIEATDAGFVENEFKREIQFYRQAQATVLEAIPKLHALDILTKRPNDYFAQMAKSDEHMKKVREMLLNKQTVMERKEKLKKLREIKKYGKQVQQEVLQKRKDEKKEMMESVQKFRKSQKNRADGSEHFNSKPVNKTSNKQKKKLQSRKEYKDKKFGFGGQKKKMKFNDKNSAADVDFKRSKKNRQPMGKHKMGPMGKQKKVKKGRRKAK